MGGFFGVCFVEMWSKALLVENGRKYFIWGCFDGLGHVSVTTTPHWWYAPRRQNKVAHVDLQSITWISLHKRNNISNNSKCNKWEEYKRHETDTSQSVRQMGAAQLRCAKVKASIDWRCLARRQSDMPSCFLKSCYMASQAKIYAKLMASWSIWLMPVSLVLFETNLDICAIENAITLILCGTKPYK